MFKMKEITPEIYLFKFQDMDQLALHLLRFAEYYESIEAKFYRQKFNLSDIVEHDTRRGKDAFDSMDGTNLPVSIIYKMAKEYGSSLTTQERFVLSAIENIKAQQPALRYLIATNGDDEDIDAYHHELAHAFYYTNPVYKMKMDGLIKVLPDRVKAEMKKYLIRLDYNEAVHNDEFQAYMATGLLGEEKEVLNEKLINMFRAKFFDVFLETMSECDIK